MTIDCAKHYVPVLTNDETLQKVITSLLDEKGYKTISASDAHELFRVIEEYHPFIIILDAGLHRILDLSLWEIMKKIDRYREIKVILITSSINSCSGADEYIEIGHIKDHLISKVRKSIKEGDLAISDSEMQLHEEAKRFARLIVSDIVLYNREKVEKGIKDGIFYEVLKAEIEEGLRLYNSRVSSSILETTNYYSEALEDFIRRCSRKL